MRILILVAGLVAISGCSFFSKANCNGEATNAALADLLRKQLEQSVRTQLERDDNLDGYDSSKLRSAARQIKLSLEEERTIRDDPDSSRQFCSARVIVKIPAQIIESVDSTRAVAQLAPVRKLAAQSGLERSAGGYATEMEFSIQPTDDGDKLVAEAEGDNAIGPFLSEVFASYMLSDEVKAQQREVKQAEDAAAAAEKAAEAEMASAQADEAAASASEAKAENNLAVQRIGAVWQAIPRETRSQLLDLQRAWIKKKNAQCRVEAAGSAVLPAAREATRLRCDTRLTFERVRQIERFAAYSSENTDSSMGEDY